MYNQENWSSCLILCFQEDDSRLFNSDELKTQLNKYFVCLGENHTTYHLIVHVPCIKLGANKDEDMWKMVY